MTYSVALDECSWQEVAAAINRGYDTVVIPAAPIVQHGAHLPLITNAVIAETLAARVAVQIGLAFAAPALRPVFTTPQPEISKSVSQTGDPFTVLLADYCLSLARHGFRKLILIATPSISSAALSAAAAEAQEKIYETGLMASVIPFLDLHGAIQRMPDHLMDPFGGRREETSGQIDDLETAMLLAIRPDLVKLARAEAVPLVKNLPVASEIGGKLLDYFSLEMAEDIRVQVLCRR